MHPVRLSSDPSKSPTLPGWTYTDPGIFEREKRDIFFRSWQYAGAAGDVAQPGGYLTLDVLGQQVVVVRDDEGQLRAFFNVCRHRGHHVASGCGRTSTFTCPYHAWTYALDGRLRSARGLERTPGFDAAKSSLQPVRVDVLARKWVFVNLDTTAASLASCASGLEADLQAAVPHLDDLAKVERAATDGERVPVASAPIRANWKVVVDNCLECYHCRPAHPAFRDLFDLHTFRVSMGDTWASLKGELRDPSVVGDSALNRSYGFWWLWPNTFFEMAPGGAHGVTVGSQVPLDIATTGAGPSHRYGLPSLPLYVPRGYADLNLVAEDRATMEAVQRNIGSLGYGEGRFSYDPAHGETSEEAVHRFHWLVARTLGLQASENA